jgi:uncharacterized protein (DUF1684 family)
LLALEPEPEANHVLGLDTLLHLDRRGGSVAAWIAAPGTLADRTRPALGDRKLAGTRVVVTATLPVTVTLRMWRGLISILAAREHAGCRGSFRNRFLSMSF